MRFKNIAFPLESFTIGIAFTYGCFVILMLGIVAKEKLIVAYLLLVLVLFLFERSLHMGIINIDSKPLALRRIVCLGLLDGLIVRRLLLCPCK